ncbi:MAG: hypothetical protein Q9217_001924 [Psora testacea]
MKLAPFWIGGCRKSSTTPAPGLLDMPSEVRNRIYEMLLTTPYAYEETEEEGHIRGSYNFHPAILRLNKQAYQEASGVFYRRNTWIIIHVSEYDLAKPSNAIDMPWMVISGDMIDAERFDMRLKLAAFTLTLSTPFSRALGDSAARKTKTFVTSTEKLPEVRLWLWLQCARVAVDHGQGRPILIMDVSIGQNLVPDKLQGEVLTALSTVRGFRWVVPVSNSVWRQDPRLIFEQMSTPPRTFAEVMQHARPYLHAGEEKLSLGHIHQAGLCLEHGYYHTLFAGAFMLADYRNGNQRIFDFLKLRRLLNIFNHRYLAILLKLGFYQDVSCLVRGVMCTQPLELTMTEKFHFVLCNILACLGLGDTAKARMCVEQLWSVTDGKKILYTATVGEAELDDDTLDIFGRMDSTKVKEAELSTRLAELARWCGGDLGERKLGMEVLNMGPSVVGRPCLSLPGGQVWSKKASNMDRRAAIESVAGVDMDSLQLIIGA